MSRAGRAIAGVVFLGIAVVIATGWWNPSEASADDTISEPVRHVKIDNDSGDITIRAADVDTTTVHQKYRYRWGEPDTAFEVRDGTLKLGDCGWQCDVSYEVVVPLGTTIEGKVDSGSVTLDGVGDVDVDADSGRITLTDIDGSIVSDVDSGRIIGNGLSGPINVEADSGRIELTLDEPGDVTAQADSGRIELTVPDVAYQVNSSVDSGREEIDIRTDPDSPHVLDLDVDSGRLTVRTG